MSTVLAQSTDLRPISLTTDIHVLAYIASHYNSAGGGVQARAGAGRELKRDCPITREWYEREQRWREVLWIAGQTTRLIDGHNVNCIKVTKKYDPNNGGKSEWSCYLPVKELAGPEYGGRSTFTALGVEG